MSLSSSVCSCPLLFVPVLFCLSLFSHVCPCPLLFIFVLLCVSLSSSGFLCPLLFVCPLLIFSVLFWFPLSLSASPGPLLLFTVLFCLYLSSCVYMSLFSSVLFLPVSLLFCEAARYFCDWLFSTFFIILSLIHIQYIEPAFSSAELT